ncbi:Endogenous retrovirus group K member 25 Rec protein [Manis javanica]|nr:Endogenous retrovirus group K member 25 Rec protein [Manis javanica]
MNKRPGVDVEPPIDEMRTMTIGRCRVRAPLPRTRKVNPPAWGQLKKMTWEVEKIVQQTGQACSTSNLFLAMIAVFTMRSGEELPKNINVLSSNQQSSH